MKLRKRDLFLLVAAPALMLGAIGTIGGIEAAKEAKADTAQAFPTSNYSYTLITSQDDITTGTKVVIASKTEAKAAATQGSNNWVATTITLKSDKTEITGWSGTAPAVFELVSGSVTDPVTYAFKDLSSSNSNAGKYLYAASSGSNYLKSQSDIDANASFKIEIAESGVATIKAQGTNSRNWIRLNNSGTPFSCYGSGQKDVYLYKVEATTSSYTVKFVTNCGQTIASQQVTVDGKVTEPTGLTKDGYELYQWTTDPKWKNGWDFNTVVTGDMTLYADWVNEDMNLCTLTFNLNGKGDTAPATQQIVTEHYFDSVTGPASYQDELYKYTFLGWFEKDDQGNFLENQFNFEVTYSENKTVYAKWSEGEFLFKASFEGNKTAANLSFAYDSEVIPGTSSEAVWEIYENGGTRWSSSKDGVSLSYSSGSYDTPGCRIFSGATFTVSSPDGLTEINFSSGADNNEGKGLSNLILLSGESGTLTKNGETATWTSGDASVTSVTFKADGKQVRLDGLSVSHGIGDVTNYSNFRDAKMQFHYDMSEFGPKQMGWYKAAKDVATETGLFVTDDADFVFEERDDLDVATGKIGKKYANEEPDQDVPNYTVGIEIPESHYNTVLHAASYILIDGTYYWNTPKDYSVLGMLQAYTSLSSLSNESKAVCSAFVAYINTQNA